MTTKPPRNLVASIQARLRNLAKAHEEDYNFTLRRYANERFLYRLGKSPHHHEFVLKGGMLLPTLGADVYRPTRDIDLLGFGEASTERLSRVFSEIARLGVEPDGLEFNAQGLQAQPIRALDGYGGIRVKLPANLGHIPLDVQVDVGFGDAVTPAPIEATYPTLLDLPGPVLRMYPLETVVAEKFEAMVRFGLANSRIKDYYDLWMIARTQSIVGTLQVDALRNTFARRQTSLPLDLPVGLGSLFTADVARRRQWEKFVERFAGDEARIELHPVAELLAALLMPAALAAAGVGEALGRWEPSRGWVQP